MKKPGTTADVCVSGEPLDQAIKQAQVRLKQAGLRITRPRMVVLELLLQTRVPMSPYRIHEQLTSAGKKVDVVSVYRVLETLQEIGLVHRIGMADGYLACALGHTHAHEGQYFQCSHCGEVVELDLAREVVSKMREELADKGFVIEDLNVELSGRCAGCSHSEAAPS